MPSRFLIIQLRRIGDVVLTTPIARILKEARPGSEVAFLAEPPASDLLRGNPYIDDLFVLSAGAGVAESLRMMSRLRARRFDVVLDFLANPRSGLLALASGARVRISYSRPWRRPYYTHLVRPDDGYAVDYKKQLLRPLAIESDHRRPEIFLSADEREWARRLRTDLLARGGRRLATIAPWSRRATHRWPPDYYGDLCGRLHRSLGARSLVLWAAGEDLAADAVVAASAGAAEKAPATTIRAAAALIATADFHVGACSGPRHVAVAVGTPSFTIVGASSEGWRYPAAEHAYATLGLPCQPCNLNTCPIGLVCLTDLRPRAVFARLEAWAAAVLAGREPAS